MDLVCAALGLSSTDMPPASIRIIARRRAAGGLADVGGNVSILNLCVCDGPALLHAAIDWH